MYKRLLQSFISLFLSRGDTPSRANFRASWAMAVWLSINVMSVLLLVKATTNSRVFEILPQRGAYYVGFVLLLLGANWLVARSIPAQPAAAETAGVADARSIRGRRLWLWYVAVSGVVFVVAAAMATAD